MAVFEIPPESWIERLDAFTVAHEGWLVTVDAFGGGIGAKHYIDNLPLLGVSVERAGPEHSVAVSVGLPAEEHLTHIIDRVTHIYADEPRDGAAATLLIKTHDATETVLQVRAAPRISAAHDAGSKAGV